MKIKEVIVVEGKNDSLKLKSFLDCDTLITSGMGLNQKTLDLIKKVNEERGVILLLDPDSPGEKIRLKINEAIPNLKNAFLLKKDARTFKKVGVEHASKEVILEALNSYITYGDSFDTISLADMHELELSGNKKRRMIISEYYHLGECNFKTLYKRLNMLGIKKEELIKILDERDHS